MSQRNVTLLGALALALFAFIVLFERETLSTGELAGRGARVLPRFSRARVTEITLSNPASGSELRLVREPPAGEDEEPRWRLTEPLAAPADQEAVASLLGVLEYADVRRRIEGVGSAEQATFGLVAARAVLRLRVGPETTELRLGGEDPTGAGVYAQLEGSRDAMVVGQDLYEALVHGVDHFRSRALFAEGLGALRTIDITYDGVTRRLERHEGRFWLRAPLDMWASEARARDIQRALGELQATRFLGDGPMESAPWMEVRAQAEPEGDQAEARAFVLEVGARCPGHEGERIARLDDGPRVCLSEDALLPLRVSVDDLRELRAVTVQDMDAEGIDVDARGSRLELRDAGAEWTATLRHGETTEQSTVDLDALSEWLRALRGLRAEAVLPADEATVRAAGLGSPAVRIHVDGRDDVPDEDLVLGAPRSGKVLARRGDEPVLLELPASALAVVDVGPARFRPRKLLDVAMEAVSTIRIERGGRVERLERAPVGFQVTEPVQAPADRVATRDLIARLAQLEAVEWVGERPDPRQGLASPRFRVELGLDGEEPEGAPRVHRLKIGVATRGGAYAQLDDDPAVFVLPQPVVDLLASSLVSRDLLATDALHLQGLTITSGDTRVEIAHDGADFRSSAGPADPQATRELVARLASLRAVRVEDVDPRSPRFGLTAPRARIEVRRDQTSDPPAYTILVGASDGEGGTYAQRADLPVVFVLPAAAVEAILAYRP